MPVRSERRGSDVLVVMDGDVDIMERIGERAWRGLRLGEVCVQDAGDVRASESLIFRWVWPSPLTVESIVGVRLSITWQRGVWILLMQVHRVVEQADLGSERSRLGRRAHRRREDSILSIMFAMMPARFGGRQGTPLPNVFLQSPA
ncbi:hypothetical protein LDL08_21020 [Nonomuraea glycinis]|uniref:Uncharacterized protein n=1 Tax=Nonomuraea glycinis TaxID=2047744 RepID=A0A918ABT3_9ACTN|nr:hypothetical protein [Nonomuraea glycinis]MCA2178675.1 hypothetical protein [Nonomuraea glycinis]GGP13771.1 hypothetical protein GCM10012278_66700 [Nonomuraea glycinis]